MKSRYQKNPELEHLMKQAGLTRTELAERAGVSRPHLSVIFRNERGRGKEVRRKVAPLLTSEIRAHLGWDEEGNIVGKAEGERMKEESKG